MPHDEGPHDKHKPGTDRPEMHARTSAGEQPQQEAVHGEHAKRYAGGATPEHEPETEHGRRAHHARMVADYRRRFWLVLALTIPILLLSPLIQDVLGIEEALQFPGDVYVQFVLASIVYFYGGWPFLTNMVGELRRRQPGMMTLIGVAITVAYVYSTAIVFGLEGEVLFWELATLVAVMLLGHWLEMRSVMGASGALEELVKIMPSEAHRLHDSGEAEDVPVSDLKKGDRVLVKPGEKVPIDGAVVTGRSAVNEAMLTGESRPVEKKEGEQVFGGSINGDGSLVVEVAKTGGETYLAQVIDIVRRSQESRSRTQNLADRVSFGLVIVALGVGFATLVAWLLVGETTEFSLERSVTVMVITCPHALGLAIPLVVAVSTTLAAGTGLLIRDRSSFERARELDAVVFDKTGTLTQGRFGVTDVVRLGNLDEDILLGMAASLESQSEHPIAEGVVNAARDKGLHYAAPAEFRAIAGQGIEGRMDGKDVLVVSPTYLVDHGLRVDDRHVDTIAAEGKTVVYVIVDGRVEGAIALADIVRPESHEAIRRLKEMGVRVMMLTGDAEAVAKWVAGDLGLDEYFAGVLPQAKADKIREIRARGLKVAMVGDGINDAPALVEADLGIAIGAGTDVAMESADVVLVRSDPRDATAVVQLSKATYSKMVQNLWWAAGYNIVAIPLAAGVAAPIGLVLPPAVGALLMSASTIIVAINARLLGREKKRLAGHEERASK